MVRWTDRRRPPRQRGVMKTPHIFVVNGSETILDLLRELLRDERYRVTTTNFAPPIFDEIAVLAPDLLVIDLAVGQHAGWTMLERLQADALTRGIPVIVTSTQQHSLDRVADEPSRYGGQYLQILPFDLDELLTAIDRLAQVG
jgi:DNA-binding response OmpR family regulator